MKYVFRNKIYIFLAAIIDLIGKIFLFFIPRTKNIDTVDNILLIRLDHLGDVIYSLFIPRILKKYYPNAKITFLVSSAMREIASSNPFVDSVICFNAPWFSRDPKTKSSLKELTKLIKNLSALKFDAGFELRGDLRHILIMYLSGIKFKIGYGITGGSFLLDLCPRYDKNSTEKDKNIKLVEEFLNKNLKKNINLITDEKPYYEYLPFTAQEELNLKFNLKPGKRYILIHPLAGALSRLWSNEKWAGLMHSLSEKYSDCGIIIVGRTKDGSLRFNGKNVIDLINKTTFKDLTGLCKISSLMISCNSGPAHIAYVLDKPLIVVASGTNTIDNWFKDSENTRIIQKKTSCYDCQTEKCLKQQHECMEEITVEEVMREAARLLS